MTTKIPFNDPGIAGFMSEEFAGIELLLGDTPALVAKAYDVAVGVNLPIYSVVGFDANGDIVAALKDDVTPANSIKPIGITASKAVDVDGTQKVSVYRAGHFNANALTWPASYDTQAERLAAFNGSPTPTNIFIGVNPNDPTFA